jgi:hypothetical protein
MRLKLIPVWARSMRMPRALKQAMRDLDQLSQEPVDHTIDLDPIRDGLLRLIGDHPPNLADPDFRRVVDEYITSSITEIHAGIQARHATFLDRYDGLEVMVRPYRERAETLARDRGKRLADLDAAVTNALDQLSDPETPIYDPRVPYQPRETRP